MLHRRATSQRKPKAASPPRPRAPAKPKVDASADTRERILQAAEGLFAEHGFDAVSMRDITALANVNLAAVNYHFGSKQALLGEVFAIRANALVSERLKLLEALPRDRNGRPRLEAAIEAFLRPSLEMSRQPGGAHHMRLRARLAVERVGVTSTQYPIIFDESNNRFIDAIAEAMPDVPREEVYWGFHCLLALQNYTMANSGRIQHLSGGICDPTDVEATLQRLVPFIAQGFRALGKRK
jgi:AcrR family transcriptional regulator